MTSWLSKNSPLKGSLVARFRTILPVKAEEDVVVYRESFQVHWKIAWAKIQSLEEGDAVAMEDVNCVLNHVDQVASLLCWELRSPATPVGDESQPRLLDLFLEERVPERLLAWSRRCGAFEPLLRTELLRLHEQLLREGGAVLLVQRAVLRPLTELLLTCRRARLAELDRQLLQLLSTLCTVLHRQPELLDLFLDLQPDGTRCSPRG
ncbi:FTS and Hook-interacting protein homolog [Pollicipes pollicipes]|uniref:FTS and Hook-interacting protein homolog n=1 Tax=Pollicipes pollicipes TaxID=41117 RepID=UPI001884F9CC|nr:FTS and Hook-interacting protein homolog [Pollicipes pollicipes]